MNNNIVDKLFFELIQVSVENRTCITKVPSTDEWNELHQKAKIQAIVGMIFYAISKLPKNQMPESKILLSWYAESEFIKRRNMLMNQRTAEATKQFADSGMRSLILKGQANASYYPYPEYRMPGDIDILVEGKRKDIIKYVLQRDDVKHVQFHHVDYALFDDVEVEVHFIPSLLNNYFANEKLQAFFKRYLNSCFGNNIEIGCNQRICMLTHKPNLVMQLVHIYGHYLFSGIGMRQFFDLYYLLKVAQFSKLDRIELCSFIKEIGIEKFVGAVMFVLMDVFGASEDLLICPVNQKEGKYLLDEIMIGGNFGMYDKRYINKKRSKFKSFCFVTYRNFRLFRRFPSDCIWYMVCRISQFLWRTMNRYK